MSKRKRPYDYESAVLVLTNTGGLTYDPFSVRRVLRRLVREAVLATGYDPTGNDEFGIQREVQDAAWERKQIEASRIAKELIP